MNRRTFLGLPLGAAPSFAAPAFRAGAATSVITPPLGYCLDGPIQVNGPARHVHDELYARCLVLDDGRERVAIAVCDCCFIRREALDAAKRFVHQNTGLPSDHVLISATHSHSVPRVMAVSENPPWPSSARALHVQYEDFLAARIADGIRRACNNLAPAEIGWGSGQLPGDVFNRRWLARPEAVPPNPFGESGERVWTNPAAAHPALIEPAGPVDPEVSVIAVRSVDGRPIAVLANFGLHYVGGVPRGEISADYFGVFASLLSRSLDPQQGDPPFVGILSNGASGDVNNIDFRRKRETAPPYHRMREVAGRLADEVLRVCRSIRYRSQAPLRARAELLALAVRKPSAARLAWAKEHLAASGRAAVYAREAILMGRRPAVFEAPVQALRIGDLAIAALPCEVFAETGLALKKQSPLRPAFLIELANGYGGYLPTPRQHELGGYETWLARSAFLEPGAEPRLLAKAVDLIGKIG